MSLSILGIVLSALLLIFNARKYLSSIFLGVFFLLVSLYAFIEYTVLYSKSVPLVAVIFMNFGFLSYLTGPMLYWYFRSVLTDNPQLSRKDLWHALPALIFLLGTLNYIITPWPFKLEVALRLVENPNFIGEFDAVYLYQIIPKKLVYLSRPVLIFVYAFASLVALFRFIRSKATVKVFARQAYVIKWLSVLLGFLFVLIVSHTLLLNESFTIKDSAIFYTLSLMRILSLIGLAGLMISIFFFPGILYGLPQLPKSFDLKNHKSEIREVFCEATPKSSQTFKTEYLDSIKQKTDVCMKELQPYLQSECNLASMAKLTNIPAHHISFFFREVKHQSFNDYRNSWRVEHAKNLILEGRYNDLSIEGIGALSGFSSRNTFYNAFKKIEGISPGSYAAKFHK